MSLGVPLIRICVEPNLEETVTLKIHLEKSQWDNVSAVKAPGDRLGPCAIWKVSSIGKTLKKVSSVWMTGLGVTDPRALALWLQVPKEPASPTLSGSQS